MSLKVTQSSKNPTNESKKTSGLETKPGLKKEQGVAKPKNCVIEGLVEVLNQSKTDHDKTKQVLTRLNRSIKFVSDYAAVTNLPWNQGIILLTLTQQMLKEQEDGD